MAPLLRAACPPAEAARTAILLHQVAALAQKPSSAARLTKVGAPPFLCGNPRRHAALSGAHVSASGAYDAATALGMAPARSGGHLAARCASTAAEASNPEHRGAPPREPPPPSPPPLLRALLGAILAPYLAKNPTAGAALDRIRGREGGGPVQFDHFAFRTFGADGCGIDALSQVFTDLGYTRRDELRFPAKKLRAFWFAPPPAPPGGEEPGPGGGGGDGVAGPPPRVFISELLVDELSPPAQDIIRRYTSAATHLAKHAALSSVLGALPWPLPPAADYEELARESEYAAWTLVNGLALNHTTVAVHRLHSELREIRALNAFLEGAGFRLSSEGGVLKVSPDGGLLQSSTVADVAPFQFADGGAAAEVAGSYIEFAQRLVLPEFRDLPPHLVRESHRREGFEVGNADKIFESTNRSGRRGPTTGGTASSPSQGQ